MSEILPDSLKELVEETERVVREHLHPIFAGIASVSVVVRMPGADFVISNDAEPELAAGVLARNKMDADVLRKVGMGRPN